MIDIHAHIIPCVDDGSQSIEESVSMIYSAYRSGVKHIVATPHFYPGLYDNYADEKLDEKFKSLEKILKNERIPVQIYKGMEILGIPELSDYLLDGNVWTINNGKYFLVEFDFDDDPIKCNMILAESEKAGFIPVIAHPERYYFVQDDPAIVYDWFMRGYGIQVNKGSVLGYFGERVKQTADSLIKHRIVTCAGSDAHDLKRRTMSMDHLVKYLQKHYGSECAELLTEENPLRILTGRRLVRYDSIPYNSKMERRVII